MQGYIVTTMKLEHQQTISEEILVYMGLDSAKQVQDDKGYNTRFHHDVILVEFAEENIVKHGISTSYSIDFPTFISSHEVYVVKEARVVDLCYEELLHSPKEPFFYTSQVGEWKIVRKNNTIKTCTIEHRRYIEEYMSNNYGIHVNRDNKVIWYGVVFGDTISAFGKERDEILKILPDMITRTIAHNNLTRLNLEKWEKIPINFDETDDVEQHVLETIKRL